jgi:hypothetical protein
VRYDVECVIFLTAILIMIIEFAARAYLSSVVDMERWFN